MTGGWENFLGLARFLQDPTTQRYLGVVSREADCRLVITLDSEPVRHLLARLDVDADEPVLIAIPRYGPQGWRFVFLSLDQITAVEYGEDASVGAVYEAIVGAGG
ncbi:MAG: hypothetical protein ACJ73S_28620 [Mycobacteriales bacterium]